MNKQIKYIKVKITVFTMLFLGIVLVACEDEYVEKFVKLTNSNFAFQYVDTTVVLNYTTSSSITVAIPDSLKVPATVVYMIVIDTITGMDVDSLPISYSKMLAKTSVATKTGELKINNSTKVFKAGYYNFYLGFMTNNGLTKYRDKPIKLYFKPTN